MSKVYVWRGGAIQIINEQVITSRAPDYDLDNLFVVDTFHDEPLAKYGKFSINTSTWKSEWVYIPLEEFPPEFRTHLLLLGVA